MRYLSLGSLTKRYNFFFLIVLVILSRLPLIFVGYGSDGDAWRVAHCASTFWHEGVYQPSRFPGFPVYEILNAPLVGLGGSVVSNIATLIVFLIAVVLFRKILLKLQVPSVNLLVWTFAFLPILWKNSATTMDYLWGLTSILLSYFLLLEKRFVLSGIVLGIAAGIRITHVAFLVPFYYSTNRDGNKKNFIGMLVASALTGFICYLPVLLRTGFWQDVQDYIADVRHYIFLRQLGFFIYRSVYSIGLLGVLSIVTFSILSRRKIQENIANKNNTFIFCLAAIVVLLVLFFLLTDEREYLIPMIPFMLIAIGIVFIRKYLQIACICLLSYAMINVDLIEHGFGKQRFSPNIRAGMVVDDYQQRKKSLEWREVVSTYPLHDSTIVMIVAGPIFWAENPHVVHTQNIVNMFRDDDVARSRSTPNLYYVYKLLYPDFRRYRQQGFTIFYLKESKEYLESLLNYDLDTAGVIPLDIPVKR